MLSGFIFEVARRVSVSGTSQAAILAPVASDITAFYRKCARSQGKVSWGRTERLKVTTFTIWPFLHLNKVVLPHSEPSFSFYKQDLLSVALHCIDGALHDPLYPLVYPLFCSTVCNVWLPFGCFTPAWHLVCVGGTAFYRQSGPSDR